MVFRLINTMGYPVISNLYVWAAGPACRTVKNIETQFYTTGLVLQAVIRGTSGITRERKVVR
jgi:hypothetical protein